MRATHTPVHDYCNMFQFLDDFFENSCPETINTCVRMYAPFFFQGYISKYKNNVIISSVVIRIITSSASLRKCKV